MLSCFAQTFIDFVTDERANKGQGNKNYKSTTVPSLVNASQIFICASYVNEQCATAFAVTKAQVEEKVVQKLLNPENVTV